VDRNLGNESAAVEGFEEAIQCLEKLKLDSEQASLEQRVAIIDPLYSSSQLVSIFLNYLHHAHLQRLSVLDFLHNQLADK
jgi:hypothetical protein